MIKFENTEVIGWEHAIRGMRNPMKYGESLTSQRIYDDAGLFGYAVCWDCHTSGLKERMEHEDSN